MNSIDADNPRKCGDPVTVPIVEEEIRLHTREVVTGRIRVTLATDTIDEIVRQELKGERVEVERRPMDQLIEPGAEPPQTRVEGNVTVIPILEEILIVEKRLRIKEEVRIIRHTETEVAEIPVALRKSRAIVSRSDGTDGFPPSSQE